MSGSATELIPVRREQESVLAHLLELYCYDMSEYVRLDLGPDGRFGYRDLPAYWDEPTRRFPFLILEQGKIAGFVLAKRGSPATEDRDDLDVAEFFVLRSYRRRGVGERAAVLLWSALPGRWVVRVLPHNQCALSFWERAIGGFSSDYEASTCVLNGEPRRVFIFSSVAPCAGPGDAT